MKLSRVLFEAIKFRGIKTAPDLKRLLEKDGQTVSQWDIEKTLKELTASNYLEKHGKDAYKLKDFVR